VTAPATLDLQNSEGYEQLWSNGSQQNLTFDNVSEQVTVGARNITSRDDNIDVDVNYDAGTIAADDTQAIVLEDANVDVDINQAGAATGVRNVSIASTGSANTLRVVNTELLTGAAVQNLTITGEGDLTVNSNNVITAGTIDASEASGDVSITVANVTTVANAGNFATGVTVRTVTMGAGDDTVDVSGATATITNSKLVGGEGRDTIIVNGTSTTLVDDLVANVSGFEVLNLAGLTQTVSAATMGNIGFESIVLTDAADGILNNIDADTDITLVDTDATDATTANGGDLVELVVVGATANTEDSLSFKVNGRADAGTGNPAVNAFYTVEVDNVETVNVETVRVAEDDFNVANVALAQGTGANLAVENVNITGDQAVVFDGSTITTLKAVDASGVTAASDRDNGEFAATITVDDATVTGSAEADAIFFGAGAEITSGEGDDVLIADDANNTNQTFATVTDFAAGDTLVLNDADTNGSVSTGDLVVDTAATLGAGSTALEEITVSVAPGETAKFGDYLEQAFGANITTAGDLAAGEVGYFEFAGNTYIVANNAATDVAAAYDSSATGESDITEGALIELTGSVDLSDFAYAIA
jgi:S-layer protein|tara:strand:- start:228 stop:2000 length:1773 start_codon:yes stop_codon:yes gene_type:complete